MHTPLAKINFDGLASQVEKRLDQIFKQPAGTARSKIRKPSANHIIVNRLDRLHKILLSIELRDTDELIIKYYKQLGYLKQIFKQDKDLIILLRLQYNLSNYIRTHKKNAHPIAFKILRSVFNRMCDIFYAKNMKRNERIKIINKEINRYNKFHKFIKNRARAIERKQVKSLSRREKNIFGNFKTSDQERGQIIRESLIVQFLVKQATADLKSYIHAELKKLRTDLQVTAAKNGI